MTTIEKLDPDEKCAPSKKLEHDTCFTLSSLKNIAQAYNNHNTDKINISLPKEQLVDVLEDKMEKKYHCSDQTCWTRQKILEDLDMKVLEEIQEKTFRPVGPSKKYGWLSTTHINEVIDQYHDIHKDFLFLGAVPYDFEDLPQLEINTLDFKELEKDNKTKIGIVINLDEHYKQGSHWVALYTDLKKNQVYFFDSVGKPPQKRIRKFINRITRYIYQKKYNKKIHINDIVKELREYSKNKHSKKYIHVENILKGGFDIRYNNKQHQFDNSECGVYSINFIIRLVSGESFESVINDITKDEMMNRNRKIYFRNVN